MDPLTISDLVSTTRRRVGQSRAEAAEAMGVHPEIVAGWERGSRPVVKIRDVAKIAAWAAQPRALVLELALRGIARVSADGPVTA